MHLPSYGTSQNPVDATAQAVHEIGYAGLARLVLDSPAIDGVIVVLTARSAKNLERQRADLARLAKEATKPILLWSYTLPAPQSTKLLRDLGYPLFTDIRNCARAMAVLADYRAVRERLVKPIVVRGAVHGANGGYVLIRKAVAAKPEPQPQLQEKPKKGKK